MRLNQSVICGRLVRDAELAYAASGTAILKMRLAFDQGSKDDKDTGFIDVTMFGERASKIKDWCTKGREIAAVGRIQYREWEKDGHKRSALEIVAFDVEFTQPAPKNDAHQPQEGALTRSNGAGAPPPGFW